MLWVPMSVLAPTSATSRPSTAVPQPPYPCYDTHGGTKTAMFDFAWSEIALIGVVALIAIGPKDMPVAIKAVAEAVKKARRMAGEFQVHVDEMVREANLHEVRDQINDIRRMDIKGKILGAVDGDGTIRKTMSETPFETQPPVTTPTTLTTPPPLTETVVPAAAEHVIPAPDAALPVAAPPDAVPAAPATPAASASAAPAPAAPAPAAPAPAAPAPAAPAPAAPAMTVPADAHQPSLHV